MEEVATETYLTDSLLLFEVVLGQFLPRVLHRQPYDVLATDLNQLLRLCTSSNLAATLFKLPASFLMKQCLSYG